MSGRVHRWLLAVVTALAVVATASAATRTEMFTSATVTASGNSAAFSLATSTNLMIGVDMTAGSSVTDIDLWLQASDDGGTTWYDYPADLVLQSANTAATGTLSAAPGQRDIIDSYSVTTPTQWVAIYRGVATDRIRLKWIFTGTSFTFSASMVAK